MPHVTYRCLVLEVGGHLVGPSIHALSASVAELNLITNSFEGFRAGGSPSLGGISWKATPHKLLTLWRAPIWHLEGNVPFFWMLYYPLASPRIPLLPCFPPFPK